MIATRWPRLVGALLGFVWFLSMGGGGTLDPTNIKWILAGDWQQHWYGWMFFRNEPWTFPLGTITSLAYPVGTNIGFTDSNPLVSLLLKPFSALLPLEFQFIGPWLALCFVLQGYMGAALTSVVTRDKGQQVLGAYLFVLSPVLAARIGHDTLCAHWLLLGLMYLGLRGYADEAGVRRASWLTMTAALTASLIHPYLAAMSLVLALACFARFWRSGLMTIGRAAATAVATIAGMLAAFWAIGYLGTAKVGSGGFGEFTSDLLALVDPRDFSGVLPPLTTRAVQWEGFGFIGLGGIVAAAIAAFVLVRRRPSLPAGAWVIVAACGLLAIYALSAVITFASHTALNLGWLYEPIAPLTAPFRASGRFIWPLHYLVLLFGVWGVTRVAGTARQSAGTILLAIVVVMQASDLRLDPAALAAKKFREAPIQEFALAQGRYRHLALFPMQVLGACGDPYQEEHVYRFMLHAARLKTTYNSGIFARIPQRSVEAACAQLDRQIEAGALDGQTIYVTSVPYLPKFRVAGALCGRFDGDWICVSGDSDETYRKFVEAEGVPERIKK